MLFMYIIRKSSYRSVFVGVVCFTVLLVGVYIVDNAGFNVRLTFPQTAMETIFPSRAHAVSSKVAETPTAAETMLRRAHVLKQRCKELRGPNMSTPTYKTVPTYVKAQIIVDDHYKVLFCWIPKIACTNFKRLFLLLSGKLKQTESTDISHKQAHNIYSRKYLRFLKEYNESQINYKLKHYKKIMFVREPVERLLSAYRDKFDTGTEYWSYKQRYVNFIKTHFRKNKTMNGIVTLDEFARYLISKDEAHEVLDIHWMTYANLCLPCIMQYDLIGKYDSIVEDGNAFLDDIGAPSSIRFPERKASHGNTADVMQQLYKDIDSLSLRKLKTLYANDSYLFDYEFPNVLEPFLNLGEMEATEQLSD